MKNNSPIKLTPENLVAHRGDPSRFPENSLLAFEAALEAGARYVEFDVQFSQDKIPVVIHDLTLDRTTKKQGNVTDLAASELTTISLKPTAAPQSITHIPLLTQMVELLNAYPKATAFVELKSESIDVFGRELCVANTIKALANACFPWVFISFDYESLAIARTHGDIRIGWVLTRWSEQSLREAEALAPEYVFCSHRKLPQGPARKANWSWVVYDINDKDIALDLLERGIDLVETSVITEFLAGK